MWNLVSELDLSITTSTQTVPQDRRCTHGHFGDSADRQEVNVGLRLYFRVGESLLSSADGVYNQFYIQREQMSSSVERCQFESRWKD